MARQFGYRGTDVEKDVQEHLHKGKETFQSLQYVWLDTCCIDKNKVIKTDQAINSMFRWYQNAKVCYAYLGDVSNYESEWQEEMRNDDGLVQAAIGPFETSEWFKRGWTLQEPPARPNHFPYLIGLSFS
ncbi:HET-domain-containing protein [Rhizodiscina lignyota]|uniref:HET-domain-containing protein n=1 Tax=Rhizodiscina lignyota TaxID=1504668 RepID=A0A9P4IAZ3_9PEZI|nr:HET-domain-containing protein [Rhizodiscina lignyota]